MRCTVLLELPAPGGWDQTLREESPTLSARRLAAELRRLRQDRQLTHAEVAARLRCSPSKLLRIESGKCRPRKADLNALLSMYKVTSKDELERLHALHRASRKPGWWETYTEVLSSVQLIPMLDGTCEPMVLFSESSGASLENELSYSLAMISGMRDRWIDLAHRGASNISGYVESVRVKAANLNLTLSSDYTRWLAAGVVILLTRILSLMQSVLAKVVLARVAAAEALMQVFLIAAFMSHRHRREPSDHDSPLMANYRPLAGVAAAW